MVQLGQKGRPFTTKLPYFMENVTTKSFGVGLERTFIGGFGLDSSLVDSDSTQVWWTRTRLEHFQMDSIRVTVPNDSDSTRVLQWVDSFQHWHRRMTKSSRFMISYQLLRDLI